MDVTNRAVELKKILKNWERVFHEKHDRKANGQDIKCAPQIIQDSYKEYNILKRGFNASSGQEAYNEMERGKITDGTWGSHLNQSTGCTSDITKTATRPSQGAILRQYSRKLHHSDRSCKLPKTPSYRKPGSVFSALSHKSTDKDELQGKEQVEECSTEEDDMLHPGTTFTCFLDNKISTTKSTQQLKPQNDDIGLGMLHSKLQQKHSWKPEWLDTIDIHDTSAMTESISRNLPRTVNKSPCKTTQNIDTSVGTSQITGRLGHKHTSLPPELPSNDLCACSPAKETIKKGHSPKSHDQENACSNSQGRSILEYAEEIKEHYEGHHGDVPLFGTSDNVLCSKNTAQALKHRAWSHTAETVSEHDSPKHKMKVKDVQILNESKVKTEENWKQNTNRDQIILIEVSDKSRECSPDGVTDKAYLQSKQGIPTTERNEVEDDQAQDNSNEHDTQEKNMRYNKSSPIIYRSSSSVSAPKRSNLNENFVKLDMKKKRYSRKGLFHMKGEAYKRQVWKQKMQGSNRLGDVARRGGRREGGWRGRGRGRGGFSMANPSDKCFKCGQTGHWASNCYGPGDEKKEEIKEGDFPTLEEAAMAACGIKNVADDSVGLTDGNGIPDQSTEAVYDFPEPPPSIQPLLQPNWQEKAEASASVYRALKQMGYKSFRPGQEQAVMRILSGLSTLVVLSTGAGKSLVYQLASLMYSQRSPCITLVISPLVSLMDDQVEGLPDCLTGVRLHSNMTKPQRDKVVKEIQAGHVNILLLSPEAIVGSGGMGGGCMPALAHLPPVAFACIDEVHCLSEWSHNFRPCYLMLCKVLRDRLGVKCMLGLTATATMATAQSVAQHLGIADDPHAIIRGTCLPDNLLLSSSRDSNRERALVELLKSERFCHLPSIIIYCIRREDTERIASLLRTCLPDEELQASPMLESNENKMGNKEQIISNNEPAGNPEEVDQVTEIDRNYPKPAIMGYTPSLVYQTGTAVDRVSIQSQVIEDEEDTTTWRDTHQESALAEGNQSQDGVIIEGVKKNTKNAKKIDTATKKNNGKTKGKRKRLLSETDDEYSFLDEETQDTKSNKTKRTKACKQSQNGKKPSNVKKKPRLSNKAARKGLAIITNANSVEAYHAGMSPAARRRVQTTFMTGNLRIVVATVAFGMGLDKSDVRAVLHFNLPKSFESYVQEIGRAGRDQRTAHCHVFLQPQGKDLCELRRHTYANTVDRYCIKKLVSRLFPHCKCQQAKRLCQLSDPDLNTSMDNDNDISDQLAVSAYQSSLSEEEAKSSCRHGQPFGNRLCKGHLVALPIESSVQELDIKEEAISTLLCYLELHPKHWLVTLPSTYATCTIQCYGGPAQLLQIAKSCPPVAVGIAKNKQRGKSYHHANSVEFDVVEVARCMGWDLNVVKRELRQLKWRQVLGKGWVKSGVTVEFSTLAFLLLSPGDLTDDEQDNLVSFLTTKSSLQERRELDQLQDLHSALKTISHGSYLDCSSSINVERSNSLKDILKEYFARPLSTYIAHAWNNESTAQRHAHKLEMTVARADRVKGDLRQFLCMHTDRSFTGRAVARIFHGIASPCYPAQVWGRDRRFWRAHLDFDFNVLLQIATEEIIRLR